MIDFFHHPICPLSRQIRIYLKELNLEVNLIKEDYWNRRKEFVEINPASTIPVLILEEGGVIGYYAITEFLNEKFQDFHFMPKSLTDRAKVREEIYWFNEKFYREVSKIIMEEKMIRLLRRIGTPRSEYIRAAKSNLLHHFRYLTSRLERSSYIAGEVLSCGDIAAAAHVSTIDFFGEINWDSWSLIKQWYSIIKSRPSFRPILQDQFPGFFPSKEYTNLDF